MSLVLRLWRRSEWLQGCNSRLGHERCVKAESPHMDRSWQQRSACKGIDPIIFYPATDEEAGTAKAVCDVCPVQVDCLEYAIACREHDGVWGGHTERERQRIIRRRRRMRAMERKAAEEQALARVSGS